MSDWSTLSVDQLCSRVTSGGTPSRSRPDFYGGAIPWIKTGELQDNLILRSEEHLTDIGLTTSSAKLLPVGTVLMAMYGATVGALARLGVEATCNQASCAMIVDPERCDPRWLFYSLLNDRERIVGLATGAAQQNLSAAAIKQLRFTTPPLPEQQAIAEVLGALDDKIAANTALAATARALALAMLHIDAPTTALADVVTQRKHQVDPSAMSDATVEHYSLPAFDVGEGPEIVPPETIKSSKFAVESPALLVSKLNPRTPRYWPISARASVPQLASTEFLVLEPHTVEPWVLWALVSQPAFGLALESKVAGTSGSHQRVKPDDLLSTHILDPRAITPSLLETIGAVLRPIDSLQAENRTLAATRDALLPQLMSGTLRVRDAEAAASAAGA